MKIPWHRLNQPPWRTLVLLGAILATFGLCYLVWPPGEEIRDGRHDLGNNGIWVRHGWLGDDSWFQENSRDPSDFRAPEKIRKLWDQLAAHRIRYVFPHLCPSKLDGTIAPVDHGQTERFLDGLDGFQVIPWIGGVRDDTAHPGFKPWRQKFISSAIQLLTEHPRLGGVHVNIEPMPDGDPGFLLLLAELRQALPPGKILSVAAYPPPSRWHPFPDVHWGEPYYREVAKHCHQLVPMLYDTGLGWQKPYQKLMADWTIEVLAWSGDTQVLLGVPAYDDANSGYHNPRVENPANALRGIHAGLERNASLPANYAGIAIYSEWTMTPEHWNTLNREFARKTE